MIARSWTGWTSAEQADAYQRYMQEVALDGYVQTPGNRGVLMLRRPASEGRTEFTMVTLWDSLEAIKQFAGADPTVAVFYPRDDDFLVDRQREVAHYDVYECVLTAIAEDDASPDELAETGPPGG